MAAAPQPIREEERAEGSRSPARSRPVRSAGTCHTAAAADVAGTGTETDTCTADIGSIVPRWPLSGVSPRLRFVSGLPLKNWSFCLFSF